MLQKREGRVKTRARGSKMSASPSEARTGRATGMLAAQREIETNASAGETKGERNQGPAETGRKETEESQGIEEKAKMEKVNQRTRLTPNPSQPRHKQTLPRPEYPESLVHPFVPPIPSAAAATTSSSSRARRRRRVVVSAVRRVGGGGGVGCGVARGAVRGGAADGDGAEKRTSQIRRG